MPRFKSKQTFLPDLNYNQGEDASVGDVQAKVPSISKSSVNHKPKTDRQRRNELVDIALRERKKKVFDEVAYFTETEEVTKEELDRLTKFFTLSEFIQLTEERASCGLCGLPTCSNASRLGDSRAHFEIDLKGRRVFNKEMSSRFCSRKCALAADAFGFKFGHTVKVDAEGQCYMQHTEKGAGKQTEEKQKEKEYAVLAARGAVKSKVRENVFEESSKQTKDEKPVNSIAEVDDSGNSPSVSNGKSNMSIDPPVVQPKNNYSIGAGQTNKPVVYFEIEDVKSENGTPSLKMGKLGVLPSEEGENNMNGVHSVTNGVDEGHSVNEGKGLSFNMASLLPGSVDQAAIEKILGNHKLEQSEDLEEEDTHFEDDFEHYREYDEDEESAEELDQQMGEFRLSLSSFGNIWNFLNSTVIDEVLAYFDQRYNEGVPKHLLQRNSRDMDYQQKQTIVLQHVSKALALVTKSMGIQTPVRLIQEKLTNVLQMMAFEGAINSFSVDEWCIITLLLLEALGHEQIIALKRISEHNLNNLMEVLAQCCITLDEYNVLLRVLLPLETQTLSNQK